MPELPEVETVRLGLMRLLPGLSVAKVDYDAPKSFPNAPQDVEAFLIGAKVIQVRRRAKVLLIDLSTSYTLVIHLKMTGQLVYRGQQAFGAGHPNKSLVGSLPDKSTRVIFHLENDSKALASEPSARKARSAQQGVHAVRSVSTGAADKAIGQKQWQSFGLCLKSDHCDAALYFNDQRKFGWVRLMPTIEVENLDFFKKVGPEPLSADFTPEIFIERLMRRKGTTIKAAILDQTVLAGIGNIYADESLWGAKIHPATRVADVPKAKLKSLYSEIRYVLELSIEKGGSTDRNYVDAEGKKGSYLTFARVFRREKLPCPRCGTTIIKTRVAGRGTHTCPKCQKQS